ncbi:lipopolysaccharide biosynthesis protein [Chitinophaga caseinilytica]|uniref:lipopolysaccharide biosynthesis protein n=1 Tax=Chitinophaga caseinilytica TaxID=2267521 RepID=UPI003C2BAEDC
MKRLKIDHAKKTSAGYILSGYVTVAANILLSIILMKKLDVSAFGMTSIGRTIFQSFEFSHLGVRYGLDRLLPGTTDQQSRLRLFWAGFTSTFVFSMLFVIFWGALYIRSINFYIFFIVSGLIYAVVQIYRVYYRSLQDKKQFLLVSVSSMLVPALVQIVSFLAGGLWVMIIAMLTTYLVVFGYTSRRYKIAFPEKKQGTAGTEVKSLLSFGFILFITALLSFIVSSGDRIFMEKYWGVDAVGEYSIIMFVFSTLSIFPGNYTELIMSEIIKRKSLSYVAKHCLILAGLTLLFCLLTIVVVPFAFSWFLPQYLYLVPHMDIVVWAAVPFSVTSVLNYYLHAIDKRKFILISNFCGTVIYLIVYFIILKRHLSIDYVLACKILYFVLIAGLLIAFSLVQSHRVKKSQNTLTSPDN